MSSLKPLLRRLPAAPASRVAVRGHSSQSYGASVAREVGDVLPILVQLCERVSLWLQQAKAHADESSPLDRPTLFIPNPDIGACRACSRATNSIESHGHDSSAAHRADWSVPQAIQQVEMALAQQQQQHALGNIRDIKLTGRPDLDPFQLVSSQMTSLSDSIADLLGSKHPVSNTLGHPR